MKLTLHIGTAQTQTTAIQNWFAHNRDGLAKQGVLYPRAFGDVNHRDLAIYASDPKKRDGAMEQRGIRTVGDHKKWCKALETDFAKEIKSHKDSKYCVISSELLHSRITSQTMARRVKSLLKPHFSGIEVVIHLRPQVDMLVSGMRQRTRSGQPVTLDVLTRKSISENNPYFNYSQIVSRWEVIFGKENVKLLPFARAQNLITHIQARAGLDLAPLGPFTPEQERLDWRVTELANILAADAKKVGGMQGALDLDHQSTEAPLQIGLKLAQDIQGRFVKSNARLIERRDDLQADDLTPDWDQYDAVPNVYRLSDDTSLSAPLTHVLVGQRQALRLAQARAALAEGALALHEKKPNAAKDALAQAHQALDIAHPHPQHKAPLQTLRTRAQALEQALGKVDGAPNDDAS